MSVDRDPKVGDVFHYLGNVMVASKTVLAVADEAVFFGYGHSDDRYGGASVTEWREEAILVQPRPKVKDTWGVLWDGEFETVAEPIARHHVSKYDKYTLARIVNGRVCDEHGVPFEVES